MSQEALALSGISKLMMDQPDLIIDCGAAIGEWSKLAKEIWPNATLLAIEPQSTFVEVLTKKEYINIVEDCLIDSSCGYGYLNITRDKFDSSMLYEGEYKVREDTHTLECLINKNSLSPRSIFIKTDLQGHDYVALQSLGEFKDRVLAIQMECQMAPYTSGMTGLSERVRDLDENGFEIYSFFGGINRPSDGLLGQVDVLFVSRKLKIFEKVMW
jgi:FkbM family methyltransferase